MTQSIGNNNIASLSSQLSSGLQALSNLGVNVGGGGATAALTAAGGTAAAGAAANAAGGATAERMKVPATGKPQVLQITGADGVPVTKYFDSGIDAATGKMRPDGKAYEITAFQFARLERIKVTLNTKPGLSTGLGNLGSIMAAAQQRVSTLSNALASDAAREGTFNPYDVQLMTQESTAAQQMSELAKKLFDSMQQASAVWLR